MATRNSIPVEDMPLFPTQEVSTEDATMIRLKSCTDWRLGTKFICERCETLCVRRSAMQKYCEPCSATVSREKKNEWLAKNRKGRYDDYATYRSRAKSRAILAGEAISDANRLSLDSVFSDESGMVWVRRAAVPFSNAFLKNHIYRYSQDGHIALRRQSREVRANLASKLAAVTSGVKVVQNKLWVDLIIQKNNHMSDAINLVDVVCDAIKDAIPLDDRWFCIKRLDWQIVKRDPQILVGIGQESDQDVRVCSYCGRLLSFDHFLKTKHVLLGIGRECKDCRVIGKPLVPHNKKLSDADTAEVVRLRRSGMPRGEIAEHFRISGDTVRRMVAKADKDGK